MRSTSGHGMISSGLQWVPAWWEGRNGAGRRSAEGRQQGGRLWVEGDREVRGGLRAIGAEDVWREVEQHRD